MQNYQHKITNTKSKNEKCAENCAETANYYTTLINEIESIYDEVRYNATTYINSTVLVLCCTDPIFTYKKLGLSVRVHNNP